MVFFNGWQRILGHLGLTNLLDIKSRTALITIFEESQNKRIRKSDTKQADKLLRPNLRAEGPPPAIWI